LQTQAGGLLGWLGELLGWLGGLPGWLGGLLGWLGGLPGWLGGLPGWLGGLLGWLGGGGSCEKITPAQMWPQRLGLQTQAGDGSAAGARVKIKTSY